MRRFFAPVLLMTASAGLAQTPSFDVSKYTAAIDAFQIRIANRGGFPAASDPISIDTFAQIDLATRSIDSPALPVMSLETFKSICLPANIILIRYSEAALATAMAAAPSGAGRERLRRGGVNALSAAQRSSLLPMVMLSLKCNVAHIPAIMAFVEGLAATDLTAARVTGLRQMREGLFNQVGGAIEMSGEPLQREADKLALLVVVAHYAAAISDAMSAGQKASLAASIKSVNRAWSPALRAKGDAILVALLAGRCSKFCAL